ncbi:M20/M25/M40 family metallo-hydrolase [Pacificimonas sp. WHA3]|uniref:M20/M25/M40 family metallo-hydrolase n=1 Tax=Pacificimonas pallii TaxID=2827236 RepID=A0ABS6SHE9_9SPHN|nr:M20/M25/M40 family metallo-hydrolase [Pacificimonas pallii]MBV7257844.1 M20/M25/M40 family metallo-hydrolase [Pacificimonas pallii]
MKLPILAFAAALLIAPAQAAEPDSAQGKAALELYRDIISMRTAAGQGQVPRLAARVASDLKAAGFADEDIRIEPMDETVYLIAKYAGTGHRAPLVFMAHMDVVDALPKDWVHDPFTLREEKGNFLGRGTVDNKMGVAHLTRAFADLKASGFTPDRDLYLAFSGDEETGMKTTEALAAALARVKPEFALNSDAGGGMIDAEGKVQGYGLQVAEKTYATFDVTITNAGGHSSRPRADNAIYDLALLLRRVEGLQFPVRANDVTRGFIRAMAEAASPGAAAIMRRFADDPADSAAASALYNDWATRPNVATTCIATMLDAGHAENALPQSASAAINCRIFPGVEVAEVQARLETAGEGIDNVSWAVRDEPTASPISLPRADVTAAVEAALQRKYPGVTATPYQEAGGTDGIWFRRAGIPTYAVSPIFMRPENGGLHGLDENAPVDSFYFGLDYWPALIQSLASR